MNIDLSGTPKALIHDRLVPVIQKVFAKAPNLCFVATTMSMDSRVTKFVIKDEHEEVGTISLPYQSAEEFRVSSRNIKKLRGDRYAKMTKHEKIAVKTILETCKKTPRDELYTNFVDATSHAVSMLGYRARSKLGNLFSENEVYIAQYLLDVYREETPIMPERISKLLSEEPAVNAIDFARIIKSLTTELVNKNGVIIKIEPDGGLLAAHLGQHPEVKRYKTTYELAVNYQEKLAMLKILEPDSAVEHVGIQLSSVSLLTGSSTVFFLVDGETVVHS